MLFLNVWQVWFLLLKLKATFLNSCWCWRFVLYEFNICWTVFTIAHCSKKNNKKKQTLTHYCALYSRVGGSSLSTQWLSHWYVLFIKSFWAKYHHIFTNLFYSVPVIKISDRMTYTLSQSTQTEMPLGIQGKSLVMLLTLSSNAFQCLWQLICTVADQFSGAINFYSCGCRHHVSLVLDLVNVLFQKQMWHTCLLRLQDELIRLLWSKVKVTANLLNGLLANI